MNGQAATIKMVTEKYYPTDWEEAEYSVMSGGNAEIPVFIGSTAELDEATEEGIIFTVTPNVSSDKYTINLFMQPLVQNFIGWDDYSYDVPMDISINGNKVVLKGEVSSIEGWETLLKVLPGYGGNVVNLTIFRPAPEIMLSLKKLFEKSGFRSTEQRKDIMGI